MTIGDIANKAFEKTAKIFKFPTKEKYYGDISNLYDGKSDKNTFSANKAFEAFETKYENTQMSSNFRELVDILEGKTHSSYDNGYRERWDSRFTKFNEKVDELKQEGFSLTQEQVDDLNKMMNNNYLNKSIENASEARKEKLTSLRTDASDKLDGLMSYPSMEKASESKWGRAAVIVGMLGSSFALSSNSDNIGAEAMKVIRERNPLKVERSAENIHDKTLAITQNDDLSYSEKFEQISRLRGIDSFNQTMDKELADSRARQKVADNHKQYRKNFKTTDLKTNVGTGYVSPLNDQFGPGETKNTAFARSLEGNDVVDAKLAKAKEVNELGGPSLDTCVENMFGYQEAINKNFNYMGQSGNKDFTDIYSIGLRRNYQTNDEFLRIEQDPILEQFDKGNRLENRIAVEAYKKMAQGRFDSADTFLKHADARYGVAKKLNPLYTMANQFIGILNKAKRFNPTDYENTMNNHSDWRFFEQFMEEGALNAEDVMAVLGQANGIANEGLKHYKNVQKTFYTLATVMANAACNANVNSFGNGANSGTGGSSIMGGNMFGN